MVLMKMYERVVMLPSPEDNCPHFPRTPVSRILSEIGRNEFLHLVRALPERQVCR